MKNILILLIIVLSFTTESRGQKPIANGTIFNNYINKFEGTWQWVSNSDTVTIKLKKMTTKFVRPENAFGEHLLGCHRYVKNGIEVESSLGKYDSLVNHNMQKLRTIYAYNMEDMDTSKAEGSMRDISKQKRISVFFEYLSNTQIRMILKNTEGTKVAVPGKPYYSGITLPRGIILTKQ